MNKIVNYFFEEDEKELVEKYKFLVKLGVISLTIVTLVVIA